MANSKSWRIERNHSVVGDYKKLLHTGDLASAWAGLEKVERADRRALRPYRSEFKGMKVKIPTFASKGDAISGEKLHVLKIAAKTVLEDRVRRNRCVLIGENHRLQARHDLPRSAVRTMKRAGVTHYFMETVPAVDPLHLSSINVKRKEKGLAPVDELFEEKKNDRRKLVEALLQAGIKVVPLERPGVGHEILYNLHADGKLSKRELKAWRSKDNLGFAKRIAREMAGTSGKFVVQVGRSHIHLYGKRSLDRFFSAPHFLMIGRKPGHPEQAVVEMPNGNGFFCYMSPKSNSKRAK